MAKVLVAHGRNQQEMDPEELRLKFLSALNSGLAHHDLGNVEPGLVEMIYYADLLPNRMEIRPTAADSPSNLQMQLAHEIADEAGTTLVATERRRFGSLELLDTVARLVNELARVLHYDDNIIRNYMSDVDRYFDESDPARRKILDHIEALIRSHDDEVILVGHSLGGLILYDLLQQAQFANVSLLVTAGSHFALSEVQKQLRENHNPLEFPPGLPMWVNVVADNDVFVTTESIIDTYPDTSSAGRKVDMSIFQGNTGPKESHSEWRYLVSPNLCEPIVERIRASRGSS